MRVLVVNAGSSSLKVSVVGDGDRVLLFRDLAANDSSGLSSLLRSVDGVEGAGHRVVHGGPRYPESVRIQPEVIDYLGSISDLAPLHMPAALAGIAAVEAALPGVPSVACFDTAFHSHMPASAATYAIPADLRHAYGIRRYGFHGFSHAYASRRAAELLGRPLDELKIVTCHLGAGASLAAIQGGMSVDTTMGFTPLEGLVMATRSGTVDPGLILWLQRHAGLSATELTETLDQRSGLAALAGTPDMQEALNLASAGNEGARLAIDVYVHRLRGLIASMAAALGGLDALVFTGGVGENAHQIRAAAVEGLRFLGLGIDIAVNAMVHADADITSHSARASTLVVTAHEDIEVAREVRRVLAESE